MVEKYGITAQLTYFDDNGEREDCPKTINCMIILAKGLLII